MTKKLRDRVRELTRKRQSGKDVKQMVAELTPVLRGWKTLRTGNAGREFHKMDYFVVKRLRRWQYRRGGQNRRSERHLPAISYTDGTAQVDGHREIPGASHTQKIIAKPCAGNRHARFEKGL